MFSSFHIPPTMSSSHSVQPKNSSIPLFESRSLSFPQPFRGGRLFLEPPMIIITAFSIALLTRIDGTAGIRVCLKWSSSNEIRDGKTKVKGLGLQ